MTWSFRCPSCATENGVHAPDCKHLDEDFATIERAYTDVLGALLMAGARSSPEGIPFNDLARRVGDALDVGDWRELHTDVLHECKTHRFVAEEDGRIYVRHPDDRTGDLVPTYEPMQTVFEYGPTDGCKDNAVFAMVSWCEMHDLTWEQTCAFVRWWLEETGGWDRGAWAEATIDELLSSKRHVHRKGLGWLQRAEAAKHVIEDSAVEQRLDANERAGTLDADDLD